ERCSAGGSGIALDPEQRHNAVADELVDAPSRCLDGLPHRREIAVEHEYHIIGKPPLGEAGEAADISEQDGDFALAALRRVDPAAPPPPAVCEKGGRGPAPPPAPGGRCGPGGPTFDVAPRRRTPGSSPPRGGSRGGSPPPPPPRPADQRPRPPQTWACGMPASRLAS